MRKICLSLKPGQSPETALADYDKEALKYGSPIETRRRVESIVRDFLERGNDLVEIGSFADLNQSINADHFTVQISFSNVRKSFLARLFGKG